VRWRCPASGRFVVTWQLRVCCATSRWHSVAAVRSCCQHVSALQHLAAVV
jgi:hypothetical protein